MAATSETRGTSTIPPRAKLVAATRTTGRPQALRVVTFAVRNVSR